MCAAGTAAAAVDVVSVYEIGIARAVTVLALGCDYMPRDSQLRIGVKIVRDRPWTKKKKA